MKQRMCCLLIAILQTTSWIHASSTTSLESHDFVPHQQGTVPEFSGAHNFESKQGGVEIGNGGVGNEREEPYSSRMMGRLGSRPPNCEHKCGGCRPCVATQIPATTDKLGIQYTNYEPEGWKCKCGSTFFNP
ncbi:hypothetical protein ES288_A05G032300v1 [Gossypium darwinii]|uniref:Epidermal patterning factor-like protein n=2 Tax=Gossypium TaxID=3633 RepID=A0A5D2QA15_GOSTO|nr:hypothetical protein ES288_A05G032300v1 [Gossypium darwinii]TYI25188.1 hypothetical protein ES332_A05G033900v1 [Gossypium tomentosum]